MASVIYNSCAIIPAPLVTFQDDPIIAGNQKRLGNTYHLTINGTIVVYKGSPAAAPFAGGSSNGNWGGFNNQFWVGSNYPPDESNPSYTLHQLYMMESKQEALRNLFATEGMWLEFQSADGSAPMKCQIKNVRIDFEEGTWFTEGKYTVSCDTDVLYLNGQIYQGLPFGDLIQQAGETWEITPNTQFIKTFDVTHTVNAVGKRGFDSLGNETAPAWIAAKNFVYDQLALGWNTTTNFSALSGSYIFNNSSLASGVLNFSDYKTYNFSRVENVDELAGSYQVTEHWQASPTPSGFNAYNVSTRRIVDDPYCNVVSTVQGTIQGFYDGLFNYDQRIQAADYYWDTVLGGGTGLLNLITATDTLYTYNVQPRQASRDYNINEGTLSYSYEFSNQLYENDAFEEWTISRKTSADNYLTTFGIAGTIKGRRYDGDTDVLAPFARANAWFVNISGSNYSTLYNRILSSKYYPEATGMGIQPDPVSKSIDMNEGEGVISYNLEFNNRSNIGGYPADLATDEYQIDMHFDRNDGIHHYIVNGTVKGLNVSDTNSQQDKFNNATNYFNNYVSGNIYSRINTYYGVTLPDTTPMAMEIGTFPSQGEITYSYDFTDIQPPILPGAYSEHIIINEQNYNQQVQVTAKIGVPGRTPGPVIQDINTTIIKSRTINIETVVGPKGDTNSILDGFNQKPNYDSYVYQLQPPNSYCENWTDQWDYRYGRYSLTAEFIYQ